MSLPAWYPVTVNSSNFNVTEYLAKIPHLTTLLTSPRGRSQLTFADPLLFALIYLPNHIRDKLDPEAPPTFADPHFDWCRLALRWALFHHDPSTLPTLANPDRHAFISPRETGKTTWWFLIIPLWAAAHGHKKFIAAFAHAKEQAEAHLSTFKAELEDNKFLREDFQDLVRPKRTLRGQPSADRVDAYTAASGFTFRAKGIDSSSLGMKDRDTRPDLLLLDDVEPQEANYNAKLVKDRLGTIVDTVIPLNVYASLVIVGTVTMPGSVVHQLVKKAKSPDDPDPDLEWVDTWKITPHHYEPIVTTIDPTDPTNTKTVQRSIWPKKWPLEYLNTIKHTRSYAKNYANDPKGADGDYWNMEDFTYSPQADPNYHPTRTALFIDPPTTQTKTSDPCGIAIVSWEKPNRSRRPRRSPIDTMLDWKRANSVAGTTTPAGFRDSQSTMPGTAQVVSIPRKSFTHTHPSRMTVEQQIAIRNPGRVRIEWAQEVRLTGKNLFRHVLKILVKFPNIRRVVIEVTQGGDLWLETFAGCPVPVEVTNPRESKEIRFARALEYYQKSPTFVLHAGDPTQAKPTGPHPSLVKLEEQQLGFPKMRHDDVVDAGVTGTLYFLEPKPRKTNRQPTARSYV